MTDSNHAPLTERERLGRIIERSFGGGCCDRQFLSVEELALEAADDVLADPTYARVAEMQEALRECVEWAEVLRPYAEDGTQVVPVFVRARALLDGDKP